MPEGTLSISGEDGERTWTMTSPTGWKVEAGKTTRVEMTAGPGVLVRGIVQEKETGRPIRGAKLGPYGGKTVESDAEGRFSFFARSGQNMTMIAPPEGYAGLNFGVPDRTIPKDVATFDLTPIELAPAGRVSGVVVDDQGRALPGVAVAASWPVDEGPNRRGSRSVTATTDGRGVFDFDGVPLAAPATLSAAASGLGRTTRPTTARVGEPPSTLTLDPSGLVAMKGRVVGLGGRPLAGARVHLRGRENPLSGRGEAVVDFAGAPVLMSDAEGRFETPRGLDPNGEYAAIAEADGLGPGRTDWVRPDGRPFPDLVLAADGVATLSALDGLVRDDAGRPVGEASAWAWFPGGPSRPAKVLSDAEGRFRIDGLHATGALVFVEAEGFRFEGFALFPGQPRVNLTLTRVGDPATPMKTLPPPMARADELALARRVIRPHAERVLKERPDDTSTTFATLSVLAKVDPARVVKAIAERPLQDAKLTDQLRLEAALGMMPEGLDKALAVAGSIAGAEARATVLARLADRLPKADRAGQLRLLDLALVASRAVPDLGPRLASIARIAGRWLDLDEDDRASTLLREFEPAARALPNQGPDAWARVRFVESLARIDLDAATRLIEGLGKSNDLAGDLQRLEVARGLAGRDPAGAERVLDGLKKFSSIVRDGGRIARAMAPKDPDRARRIVDRMLAPSDESRSMPFNHAYALGLMARALAGTDKARASALLDDAYAELSGLAETGGHAFGGAQDAAIVAAALAPVAEAIDPGLVSGYFWRAASLRGMAPAPGRLKSSPDATRALLFARYDAGVARVLLRPILEGGMANIDVDVSSLLRATAALDPARAVELLEAIPEDPDASFNPARNFKNEAILDLASALAAPPEARWDQFLTRLRLRVAEEGDDF